MRRSRSRRVAQGAARDHTLWAAERALDAACERVPYPEDAAALRPLAEDAAAPAVRHEIRWREAYWPSWRVPRTPRPDIDGTDAPARPLISADQVNRGPDTPERIAAV